MLISRGFNLLNHISKHGKGKSILTNMQLTRFSHEMVYRSPVEPNKHWLITSEIIGGLTIWWILYRFYYDYGHITGHWRPPDPSKWTDEELGIPPDDSD